VRKVTIYFHRTSQRAADRILVEGFRDATDRSKPGLELTGVFVSDIPLGFAEGAEGDALLSIGHEADFTRFELVDNGKAYREWCVPAAILNHGWIRQVSSEGDLTRPRSMSG